MSIKTSRIAALATTLVAVGVMSVATTSASAKVILPTEETCSETSSPTGLLIGPVGLTKPVSGTITVKKLGQNIALKNGLFGGTVGLCVREGEQVEGGITEGKITFPPFLAPVKILGISTELGMAIIQSGVGEGTITRPAGPPTPEEEENGANVNLNVQAEANIAFTSVNIAGIKLPTQCETVQPVKLPLVKTLSLLELLFGTTINGTATLPNIKCRGLFGGLLGPVLSLLMSGPDNPFSIVFEKPPEE